MALHLNPPQPDLTNILQTNVDDLWKRVACTICIQPMYEPYTTQCGHTFCYSCLRQWFDRDHAKKTCPDCRAHVQHQPAPAFLLREIIQLFINTTVLLPAGESTDDHRKAQREEAQLVEKDKANHNTGRGLFNGRFTSARFRPPIRDAADGVDRCPRCTWELEAGICQSCHYNVLRNNPYLDAESMNSEAPSYTTSMLQEMLVEDDEFADFASDVDGYRRRGFREPIRHETASPRLPHHRLVSGGSDPETSDDEDDESTDGSASTGSLRDFMVDDMAVDGIDAESGNSSDQGTGLRTYNSDTEGPWDEQENEPSSPGIGHRSDTTSATIAFRRPRRRRVAMSSPDPSDSDISDSTNPSRQTSLQSEDYLAPGGFSPLQSEPDGGRSQDVPIQIDSDSDVPVIRHRRKRRTALSVSSDSGDNGARGVNNPASRSSRASCDRTARNHDHSSASSRVHSSHSLGNVNSPPSPINSDSSPARPTPSSHSSSPRVNARRRPMASGFFGDSDVYERDGNDGLSRESSRNTPRAPSDLDEALRSRLVRMREQSEPRVLQSSPRIHDRQERKRLKIQRRARQRRGETSRGGSGHRNFPQQLAYIGG